MSDRDPTPPSVVALYQQLAAERAGAARAALARASARSRGCSPRAPPRSRRPPARCCTPPCTFIALDGPLPGLFAEQAGALLAVAARFEEAADLTRARQSD